VNADQRRRTGYGFGAAANLDAARAPGVGAGEVVDDDRRGAGGSDPGLNP
jgi:hypothetical protein